LITPQCNSLVIPWQTMAVRQLNTMGLNVGNYIGNNLLNMGYPTPHSSVKRRLKTYHKVITMESELTAFKITKDNGETYNTSMAKGVTLKQVMDYFTSNTFTDEINGKEIQWTATKIEQLA